jgi:hypothetical protein
MLIRIEIDNLEISINASDCKLLALMQKDRIIPRIGEKIYIQTKDACYYWCEISDIDYTTVHSTYQYVTLIIIKVNQLDEGSIY